MNSLKLLGFGLFVVSAHHKPLKNADSHFGYILVSFGGRL